MHERKTALHIDSLLDTAEENISELEDAETAQN